MAGYVFISYSHASDQAYVARLAAHLTRQGITVWFDREIVHGDRWATVIRDKIDQCAAFVVVMTPASEASDWVTREVTRAEDRRKPIFPLLLDGDRFFSLSHLQYDNVTGGRMPNPAFVTRLRAMVADSPADPTPPPPTPPPIKSTVDKFRLRLSTREHRRLSSVVPPVAVWLVVGAALVGLFTLFYRAASARTICGRWTSPIGCASTAR